MLTQQRKDINKAVKIHKTVKKNNSNTVYNLKKSHNQLRLCDIFITLKEVIIKIKKSLFPIKD